MTMKDLEREIVSELRVIAKNKNIRIKDMLEWSTGDIVPQDGEIVVHLPSLGVNCTIKKELYKGD